MYDTEKGFFKNPSTYFTSFSLSLSLNDPPWKLMKLDTSQSCQKKTSQQLESYVFLADDGLLDVITTYAVEQV